jgi:hypothetical protein
MKFFLLTAAAFAVLASPANATIGLLCKPASAARPHVGVVFGAGADGGIAAVNLKEGADWRSSFHKQDDLVLSRSASDRRWVRADFLDTRRPQRRGRLSVRISGYTASGTLILDGRRWAVRCIQD